MLQADLGRAEDVAGGMERDADAVDVERLGVAEPAHLASGSRRSRQDPETFSGSEVGSTAPGDVVAVRVGDDRAVGRRPGVDVEVAGLAIDPAIGQPEETQFRLITPQ